LKPAAAIHNHRPRAGLLFNDPAVRNFGGVRDAIGQATWGTEANFWRLAVATALLAIWAHTYGQGLRGDSFALFLISGVIGVGADVFLFQALPRLGSRLSLLIIQCFSALSAAAPGMAVAGHQALRSPGGGVRPYFGWRGARARAGQAFERQERGIGGGNLLQFLGGFWQRLRRRYQPQSVRGGRAGHQDIDGATALTNV